MRIEEAMEKSVTAAKLSEAVTVKTRALPAHIGHPQAETMVREAIAEAVPVEIGFTDQDWLKIEMPILLPRKEKSSRSYVRGFLYRGCNGNTGTRNVFGTDIALLMQLEVDREVILITDESWIAAQDGPIRFNDIQLGEKVDARKAPPYFHHVKVEDFGYDNLICTNTLPIRERETFNPKLIQTPDDSIVLDFGQNISGYVSFSLNAKDGQTIKLIHGEYLDAEGNFSDDNFRTIGRKQELHQVVEYTCKEERNEYTPTLCIFGFQMVKVETDIAITGEEFTAHAVYSNMEQTVSFECDHPLVNKLMENTMWSQQSNFVDIPMACPQRERSGWTGDAGVFVGAGLLLMDPYPVFSRWLGECRVDQYEDGKIFNMSPRRQPKPSKFDEMYDGSCGWGDAVVIIPYTMYKLYGDKRILEENYDMMRRWLGYCEQKARKHRLKNLLKKKANVVDTTGAGDTFNGAFAYALANDYFLEQALCFANIAASLSTEGFGAQGGMPTFDMVKKEFA